MQFFETIFLEEADNFMQTLDKKTQKKVMYIVRVAEQTNDSELFKKLNKNIWEFRTKFLEKHIRVPAFGIKPKKWKHWFWQPTDSLKKLLKHQKVK